jgi:hypothetical protein
MAWKVAMGVSKVISIDDLDQKMSGLSTIGNTSALCPEEIQNLVLRIWAQVDYNRP